MSKKLRGLLYRHFRQPHWEGCADVHWDCRIAQLEAELARLRALNARLVEDAERLAFWAREFYARHELEDNNTDMEIVADVSSHRALMAEINEPNCTMEDK